VKVTKKSQTRLSRFKPNPNQVEQNLQIRIPIQIHHKGENPPDSNPNPRLFHTLTQILNPYTAIPRSGGRALCMIGWKHGKDDSIKMAIITR